MSQWLNAFLILIMVVAVWPSLVYVIRELMEPVKSSRFFRATRKGSLIAKRPVHPADPPVCMAKLIMLRHRIQQANARRSNQRLLPVTRPNHNVYTHPRHRPAQSWSNYSAAPRRWTSIRY
ncbi:hypothetical protein M422DRAFT_62747 [Sphaerobolus stellatus SS14]|nr:hypothetical protein M422DRAFT_62747 [Sphaerobolus stellatus SS14]